MIGISVLVGGLIRYYRRRVGDGGIGGVILELGINDGEERGEDEDSEEEEEVFTNPVAFNTRSKTKLNKTK